MAGSVGNYYKSGLAILGLVMLLGLAADQAQAQLQVGFYRNKCNATDVESTVRSVVWEKYQQGCPGTPLFSTWVRPCQQDATIVAALLRMQFHDCFVQGCDASILLDGPGSEKAAPPNLSVRGYEVIDAVKTALEAACPEVVSCADIIAMATRDAVSFANGGFYNVQTGRRDSASPAKNVALPAPNIPINQALALFNSKRLSPTDMVYLLGGHTVGVTHCAFYQGRLYNYQNSGKPDPNMSTTLVSTLRQTCPDPRTNGPTNATANLDQNPASALVVDNSYHKQLLRGNGVLQVDQDLASRNFVTRLIVSNIAARSDFNAKFGQAMVNMGAVEVLTGLQGQVRKSCRAAN